MCNQSTDVKMAEALATAGTIMVAYPKWDAFKHKAIQLFGGLIMEKNDEGAYVISVGRVAFWMAFLPAVGIWLSSKGQLSAGEAIKDISPNHFNMLVILAGYNLGKKAIDTVKSMWGSKSDAEDGPG